MNFLLIRFDLSHQIDIYLEEEEENICIRQVQTTVAHLQSINYHRFDLSRCHRR